jgi:sugar phosphate isomerase/epimerase
MTERLISLAAGVMPDVGPQDVVAAAAAAGWPACGVWFDDELWSPTVAAEVRFRLDSTGLVALDMEPVIITDGRDWGDALVDAAADIGARHVLCISRSADFGRVAERFGVLCDRAAPAGITVVLEFLPVFEVATLQDAASIVRDAARSNGGVLIDNLHLARAGSSPADVAALRAAGDVPLPYVQLADAGAPPPGTGMADGRRKAVFVEAIDGRMLPGDGELPIDEVWQAAGCPPVSWEVRSQTLRERTPDPFERASLLLGAARKWLA